MSSGAYSFGETIETSTNTREHRRAVLGQAQRVPAASKQRDPKIRFEALNLLTDRRGRDMQFLGRQLEAQMACRSFESAKVG